jgi:hypothetical protein
MLLPVDEAIPAPCGPVSTKNHRLLESEEAIRCPLLPHAA